MFPYNIVENQAQELIEKCAEKGIVVFNSPGANAEAVKELELCSLVMASRDVLGAPEKPTVFSHSALGYVLVALAGRLSSQVALR